MNVVRHESELGTWTLVGREPDPRLRGLVAAYEDYVEECPGPPVLRQQVPTSVVPLILNFGAAWHVGTDVGDHRRYDSFVAGLGEQSSFVAATGAAHCVQVDLTPLGAFSLLGARMDELANEVVSLDEVLGDAPHLRERLVDAGSARDRFELLDAIFLRRMQRAHPPDEDVTWAWGALRRTHGRAPIGWICDRIGRSRRHLAMRFREQIGLPPKTVGRVLRFERAVSLLRRGDALADVAFECGYYDQAHLSRDFRAFAGKPPAAFARLLHPDGGVIV
jgi:AraC-like DNA-binding protein